MPRHKELPELRDILELRNYKDPLIRSTFLDVVKTRKGDFPLVAFSIGSERPEAPCFGIFAGVHGLERVGTHVAITFLTNLLTRMSWDDEFRESLQNFRIVSVPLINPGGMAMLYRSNPEGVDLMRNAPVESDEPLLLPVAGQRYSSKLPWYRGDEGKGLEKETQAVADFVRREMFASSVSMSLDIHSGFGIKDRLWYPYAKTLKDFPFKKQMCHWEELLDRTFPYHIYHLEAQSQSYRTHGDLWDYLFDQQHQDPQYSGAYIPLTLEMGSWRWVKKNPLQVFSVLGMFNPIKQHRYNRIMRRHILLMDFICQSLKNPRPWLYVE